MLLLHHSGIAQAAAVAMPDPRLGERASAFLVASERELTLPEVQAHLGGLAVAMSAPEWRNPGWPTLSCALALSMNAWARW
jgi:non-ribosomal peptide synthetase component E (peptide arylation enzyme)